MSQLENRAYTTGGGQQPEGVMGVIETMRRAISGLLWAAMPLEKIRQNLSERSNISLEVWENSQRGQRGYLALLGLNGHKVPAAAVSSAFSDHVVTSAFRVRQQQNQDGLDARPQTRAERQMSAQFHAEMAAQGYNIDPGMAPTKIVEKMSSGTTFRLPYGNERGTNVQSVAAFINSSFPGKKYVVLNGEGYLANSKMMLSGPDPDPRMALMRMASKLDNYVTRYNKVNPGKPFKRPFEMSSFATLDVEAMKGVLRKYFVFDEKLRANMPVLMRNQQLIRASAISPWLSSQVISFIQSPNYKPDFNPSELTFSARMNAFKQVQNERAHVKAKAEEAAKLKQSHPTMQIRQQVVKDSSGTNSIGAFQKLTVISKQGNVLPVAMRDLEVGRYDLLSNRGYPLGHVEVKQDGSAHFFNGDGKPHNAYGPAVIQGFGSGKDDVFMFKGQESSKSQINENLSSVVGRGNSILKSMGQSMPRPSFA